MSASCRAFVLSLSILACFLQVLSQGPVLWRQAETQNVFLRSKRANSFLVEEILQGNLERECYEELCNFEEAREYFEDNDRTIAFWTVYYDGDQCDPHPCLHGGNCTDKVGGFHCSCVPPYYGQVCELQETGQPPTAAQTIEPGENPEPDETIKPDVSKCPTEGPTACDQFCTASLRSFTCSCMTGFKLHTDGHSCLPEVEFPCGRVSLSSTADQLNTPSTMCRHGNCPWQVSLVDSKGVELCGGVVLGRRSVLTAASCLALGSGSDLRPSSFFVVVENEAAEVFVPIQALYIHNRFRTDRHDNDLALLHLATPLTFGPTLIHLCLPTKDFSENILMHSGRTGLVAGWANRRRNLVYMMLEECHRQLNVSHPLSNKMFCMRSQNRAEGSQNGGGSHNQDGRYNRRKPQTRSERANGATEKQNGDKQNTSPKHLSSRIDRQHGAQKRLSETVERQNETHQIQNGSWEDQNPRQEIQTGAQGKPNGTESQTKAEDHHSSRHNSSKHDGGLRSEVSGRRCSRLLPGSPVATEEKGTVFLTGLLISSPAGCDGNGGLVFTKLSRYLSWIRQRLELTKDHMTPQVNQYPEER